MANHSYLVMHPHRRLRVIVLRQHKLRSQTQAQGTATHRAYRRRGRSGNEDEEQNQNAECLSSNPWVGKGGFGADAYTLARTLLENMIVVARLLPEDVALHERRIGTFILHMEAFFVRFEELTLAGHAKYGTTDPDFGTTSRTRELSLNLVRLRKMAGEVGLEELYQRLFPDERFRSFGPGRACLRTPEIFLRSDVEHWRWWPIGR